MWWLVVNALKIKAGSKAFSEILLTEAEAEVAPEARPHDQHHLHLIDQLVVLLFDLGP